MQPLMHAQPLMQLGVQWVRYQNVQQAKSTTSIERFVVDILFLGLHPKIFPPTQYLPLHILRIAILKVARHPILLHLIFQR